MLQGAAESTRGGIEGQGTRPWLDLSGLAQLCVVVVVGGEREEGEACRWGNAKWLCPVLGQNVKNENSLTDGGKHLRQGEGGAGHGAPLRGCCVHAIHVCCVRVSGGIMLWMGEAVAAAGLLAPGQGGVKGMNLSQEGGEKKKGMGCTSRQPWASCLPCTGCRLVRHSLQKDPPRALLCSREGIGGREVSGGQRGSQPTSSSNLHSATTPVHCSRT